MKLLALPKSEVEIIPNDLSQPTKTFTYYLNDPYPSEEMATYITVLNKACKKKVNIFPPLIELSEYEYRIKKEETDKFKFLSGGMDIPLKEDLILDNCKITGCFIKFKSSKKQENGNFHCEIGFTNIELINNDA